MNIQHQNTPCTCGNHLLLPPGSTCEICMGTVPEAPAPREAASHEQFAVDYFEALEQALAQTDLAA